MGQLKALILASAIALVPQLASAADLLPPPPPLEHPMLRGAIEPESGFYLRGDVGVGINTIRSATSTFTTAVPNGFRYDDKQINDTAFLGFGAGYQFNSWFRADLTGEYRTSASYTAKESYIDGAPAACTAARCSDYYNGSVKSAVFLANGYVDLGTWYKLTPYLGAGIGFAHHTASVVDTGVGYIGGSPGGFSASTSKTGFAWALMAGLGYSVNQHLKLEIGYRYLDTGTFSSGAIQCFGGCGNQETQKIKLASHDLRIGMRWMFNEEPTYIRPIVSKY